MTTTPAGDPVVLAFDVGGTSVKAAALDGDLRVLTETTRPSRRGAEILDVLEEAARDLVGALTPADRVRVVAAGIALPGLVDPVAGVAVQAVNLDLHDQPVAVPMAERLGLPVRVGHDVTVAGEAVRRAAPDLDDPFVVIIGTGIAAAAFVGGRAVTGVSGQAGEFGHVVVRPGGLLCACGNHGCLETVASAGAIVRIHQQRTGVLLDGAHEVVARIDTDPVAKAVWAEAMSALADGLVTVCALLAPGAIVFGGGLAGAGDRLVDDVRGLMIERSRVASVPPVSVTSLGSSAGVLGAGLLALDLLEPGIR